MHTVSATLLSCIHGHSSPYAAQANKPTPGRSPALPTPPHSGTNESTPYFSTSSWPSPPPSSSPSHHNHNNHAQSLNAPRSILASLLARSEALPKPSVEVTPVQAWHQLAGHAAFGRLSVGALEVFGERLLAHIKCYGYVLCLSCLALFAVSALDVFADDAGCRFGGVIKQEFLDGLLRQL